MNKKLLLRFSLAFLFPLLLNSTSAFAHHSFSAQFDINQPIKLTGVVSEVEWTNPHAHFFVEVMSEEGLVESWDFELGSPNTLIRMGFGRDTLELGGTIIVDGFKARNGSNTANTRAVRLLDGTRLFEVKEAPRN